MKYIKTELGQQAFKARSPLFSVRQRTAFIMFDGQKSVEQVLASGAALGLTQDDVDHMVAQGFLAMAAGEAQKAAEAATKAAAAQAVTESFKTHTAQDRYKEALPIATKLTASLGLRGFRLNLAVEGASGYDELLALLPKIKEAVGAAACAELERTLTQ
ncbi:MAG: hypothetical protein U1E84_10725 [Rhodoferax sp.]